MQRMTAAFLSAVLIAGMAAGTVPTKAFAEEGTELSEAVSGNTTEETETETTPEPADTIEPTDVG